MTKKEKVAEAKRLKAEIDGRKQPQEWKPPTKEKLAEDNRIRYKPKRNLKDVEGMIGKYRFSKHHDDSYGK